MTTLSKTGKIYTYTHTQENYRADNALQVLGSIIETDPEFKNTELCTWKIYSEAGKPWISFKCRYTTTWTTRVQACQRIITIITETEVK